MIDPADQNLSISRQCQLLKINRSTYYYKKKPIKPIDLELMALIDQQYLKTPTWGSRSMRNHLRRLGYKVNRKRVQRLMRLMGLEAIYPKRKTSRPHPDHKVYPYLLRNMKIDRPNQVWAADITYIPMSRGFMYLVAVMDWHSRKVLAWRLSNTMEADFCIEAVEEAILNSLLKATTVKGHGPYPVEALPLEPLREMIAEIASASQSVAESASKQAASIEETSASLEELTAMAAQNSDHAHQADQPRPDHHRQRDQAAHRKVNPRRDDDHRHSNRDDGDDGPEQPVADRLGEDAAKQSVTQHRRCSRGSTRGRSARDRPRGC